MPDTALPRSPALLDPAAAAALVGSYGAVSKGAALMTGTTMDPPDVIASAWPSLGNRPLSEVIRRNIETVGLPKWSDEEVAFRAKISKSTLRRAMKGLTPTQTSKMIGETLNTIRLERIDRLTKMARTAS